MRGQLLACGTAICLFLSASVEAQTTTLLDDVHTIASPDTGVPVEHDFSVSAAGTYQVQLTDLGKTLTPSAPIGSVSLALTSGDAIVGTPLSSPGTLSFTAAAAGTYRIHLVGMPMLNNSQPVPGSGLIGLQVSGASGTIFSWSDNIALPPQAIPSSVGALNDSFTVTTTGTYLVALADLQWPQALGSPPTLLLTLPGSNSPVILSGGTLQASVPLTQGASYQIFALGQLGMGSTAGLYSVSVTPTSPGGSAPIYAKAVPVGAAVLLTNTLLNAGSTTFAAVDLQQPAPLAPLTAVVVSNGTIVAQSAAPAPFQAAPNTYYQIFAAATPAPGSAGSYAVQLSQGGQTVVSFARGVADSGSSLTTYSFDTNIATAGSYAVNLTDFQFPKALVAANLVAVQGTTVLTGTPLTAPGSANVIASAGPLTLLGFAQPASGGSLLDVNVASGSTLVFDATQAIGVPFDAMKLSIPTGGSYKLSANDLGFPSSFSDFAVLITQAGTSAGSIVVGGSTTFQATPGNYYVNFLAHPSASAMAGTYALNVVSVPPPPVVTLTADAASVSAGGAVRLNWTATNAAGCIGSGGGWSATYSGSQAANGSAESPAISTATTFTLTCDNGAGTTAAQSVTVSITAAPPAKSGGGGLMDLEALLALAGSVLVRLRARARAPG